MNSTVQHSVYGTIVYEEGFWSGKKSLTINGIALTKTDKTHYQYDAEGISESVELKGNTMTGVALTIRGEKIQLVEKPAWYVLTLSLLMFVFVLVWGNFPPLVQIFPVVGGAIGGLIGGLCAVGNILIAGKVKNVGLKLLVGVVFFAATVLLCHLLALAFLSAVGAA